MWQSKGSDGWNVAAADAGVTCVAQVTVINFTVTLDGLEEQVLADIVGIEKAELEESKNKIIQSVAADQRKLKQYEDNILEVFGPLQVRLASHLRVFGWWGSWLTGGGGGCLYFQLSVNSSFDSQVRCLFARRWSCTFRCTATAACVRGLPTGIFVSHFLATERYLWSFRPLTGHSSFCAVCCLPSCAHVQ